jgi:taurine--2-oxoglutarate transaminase
MRLANLHFFYRDPLCGLKGITNLLIQKSFMATTHKNKLLVAPPLMISIDQLRKSPTKFDKVSSLIDKKSHQEARTMVS